MRKILPETIGKKSHVSKWPNIQQPYFHSNMEGRKCIENAPKGPGNLAKISKQRTESLPLFLLAVYSKI